MNRRRRRKSSRRGLAIPEWFCILGLLGIGIVALFFSFGETLRDYTDNTAEGVADPGQLVDDPIFESQPPDQPRRTAPPAQPRRKGNNGVGNGLDPQPPGNPPINDGPGTGPGNPGNRGGAKR